MTTATLAVSPIAVIGGDLLYMMLGAAALGALFVWTASHLFSDKPLRRGTSRSGIVAPLKR